MAYYNCQQNDFNEAETPSEFSTLPERLLYSKNKINKQTKRGVIRKKNNNKSKEKNSKKTNNKKSQPKIRTPKPDTALEQMKSAEELILNKIEELQERNREKISECLKTNEKFDKLKFLLINYFKSIKKNEKNNKKKLLNKILKKNENKKNKKSICSIKENPVIYLNDSDTSSISSIKTRKRIITRKNKEEISNYYLYSPAYKTPTKSKAKTEIKQQQNFLRKKRTNSGNLKNNSRNNKKKKDTFENEITQEY